MNNFIRIVIAGGVATFIQRISGFNPISIEGFAVFMGVFMILSFALHKLFAKKEETLIGETIKIVEKTDEEKKSDTKVVIVVILVALVFGGFYYYDYYKSKQEQIALQKHFKKLEKKKQQQKLAKQKAKEEKLKKEQKKYHQDLSNMNVQELSNMNVQELAALIQILYLETAFLRKTNYAIKLFDTYYSKDEIKHLFFFIIKNYFYHYFSLLCYYCNFNKLESPDLLIFLNHLDLLY